MRRPRDWRVPFESLKQGSNRLEFELDIADIGGEEREVAENPLFEKLVGPVRVELEIVRTGRRFLVDGNVRFEAVLVCAVCGRVFRRTYADQLQTEFLGEGELPPPDGKVSDGQYVEKLSFRDDLLDLGPLVRDAVHLAVPIAPLCRPGCKGLCSVCGTDMNVETCVCRPITDSPFGNLRAVVGDEPVHEHPQGG